METNKVFFKPWVGPEYLTGGIFNRRIMVLGESHYCGEPCEDCGGCCPCRCDGFTSDVVRGYLDWNNEREGWMTTYLKFERALVGRVTVPEESTGIWNSLLFYNYLQVAMGGPRAAGTAEQYQAGAAPFFSVMDRYQPDLLVVWGVRLWGWLPCERWEDGPQLTVDGGDVRNGYYRLADGRRVRAVCLYHPSAGFSWDYWNKVLRDDSVGLGLK